MIINELISRYPNLNECSGNIQKTVSLLVTSLKKDNRLYICGNGGSAADALHITGELVKSFARKRSLDKGFTEQVSDAKLLNNLQGALPVFSLVENTAFSTAFANDCDAEFIYAQQVYAYARKGDCILGISTSGNSKNIINAINVAKGRGAVTIGLTGSPGGKLKEICDCCIAVPETQTYKIQELHLPVYHAICLALEEYFWGEEQ